MAPIGHGGHTRSLRELCHRGWMWTLAALILGVTVARAPAQPAAPGPTPAVSAPSLGFRVDADVVTPPGLPDIGKWMIARDGTIAHWLGETHDGKALREPINVILVDEGARSADDAKRRLVAASAAAGYPVRFGHSTGYRGYVGGQLHPQLPEGRDDAFSNRMFELSNNHGRIFGPHRMGNAYVSIGAFSREEVRPFRSPAHGYASFNRARDDYAQDLDGKTPFKVTGFVNLGNAMVDDPKVTTGDHDGLAVLLHASR